MQSPCLLDPLTLIVGFGSLSAVDSVVKNLSLDSSLCLSISDSPRWYNLREINLSSVVQNFLQMCSPRIYYTKMTTTLQAWGNSQGVRIPKALLAALQLKTGMSLQVELSPKKDAIIVKPAQATVTIRGRHKIEDLVSKMPRNYKAQEFFSDAQGCEVW